MDTEFEIFEVRYRGDELSDEFMSIAICVSEISKRDDRLLACACTEQWDELKDHFPDADIEFVRDWCEALKKDFCAPDANVLVAERLRSCSSHIDVSVSRRAVDVVDEPSEALGVLVPLRLN